MITADDISRLQACAPTAEIRYCGGTSTAPTRRRARSAERFLVEMGRVLRCRLLSSWATGCRSRDGAPTPPSSLAASGAPPRACARRRRCGPSSASSSRLATCSTQRRRAAAPRLPLRAPQARRDEDDGGRLRQVRSGRVSNRTAHEPTAHPAPPATGTRADVPAARRRAARGRDPTSRGTQGGAQLLELSSALTIEGSRPVAALRREIDDAAAELYNHGAGAPFAVMMGPFLAGAGAAQEALVARLASLKASFAALDAYLGETSDAAGQATLGASARSPHRSTRRAATTSAPSPAEEGGGGGASK